MDTRPSQRCVHSGPLPSPASLHFLMISDATSSVFGSCHWRLPPKSYILLKLSIRTFFLVTKQKAWARREESRKQGGNNRVSRDWSKHVMVILTQKLSHVPLKVTMCATSNRLHTVHWAKDLVKFAFKIAPNVMHVHCRQTIYSISIKHKIEFTWSPTTVKIRFKNVGIFTHTQSRSCIHSQNLPQHAEI